jgi:hypothetical protein
VVFIIEESSKRRVNAYIPKYISMAYYIMFLWIRGLDGTRSKVTGNFLVNALHAFYRINWRYHVKNSLMRMKVQGRLTQTRFNEIHQVFAKNVRYFLNRVVQWFTGSLLVSIQLHLTMWYVADYLHITMEPRDMQFAWTSKFTQLIPVCVFMRTWNPACRVQIQSG